MLVFKSKDFQIQRFSNTNMFIFKYKIADVNIARQNTILTEIAAVERCKVLSRSSVVDNSDNS